MDTSHKQTLRKLDHIARLGMLCRSAFASRITARLLVAQCVRMGATS